MNLTKQHLQILTDRLNEGVLREHCKLTTKQVESFLANHFCEDYRFKMSVLEMACKVGISTSRVKKIRDKLNLWGYDEPLSWDRVREIKALNKSQIKFTDCTAKYFATVQNTIINKESDIAYAS